MDKSETAFKAWQDRRISYFQLIRILKEHNEELKKEMVDLIEIAERLAQILLSGETYDFFNEHDWKEGCEIAGLLDKIKKEN